MKILIISDISGYMRGGVPTETQSLILGLLARGHSVALAGDRLPAGLPDIALYVVQLPIAATLAAEVKVALDDFQPDFIHLICMSSKGIFALSSLLSTYRWALTVHSVPPYERKLNRWHEMEFLHYAARGMRFALNSFAWRWIFTRGLLPLTIVHSKFVRDIVVGYGARPAGVRLIPLPYEGVSGGYRNNDVAPRSADPLMVTVGGFAHTKGQHDVVKALPGLIRRFPGIRYQMIGEVRDETYLTYLRRLAENRRVTQHLLICPDLDSESKLKALQSADVYVQPSHEEGFCLAFAEAAAIVPRLVGARAGAIAAMSRDDAGTRIVPVKSPVAICEAVSQLLGETLPPDLMQSRARRLALDFSLERYLAEHERVYEGGNTAT